MKVTCKTVADHIQQGQVDDLTLLFGGMILADHEDKEYAMNASTDTMMRKILLILSLLCTVSLPGCKGKEGAEPGPAIAGAAPSAQVPVAPVNKGSARPPPVPIPALGAAPSAVAPRQDELVDMPDPELQRRCDRGAAPACLVLGTRIMQKDEASGISRLKDACDKGSGDACDIVAGNLHGNGDDAGARSYAAKGCALKDDHSCNTLKLIGRADMPEAKQGLPGSTAPAAPSPSQFTPDQVRAAAVAEYLITLQRNAANCEQVKKATAATVVQGMKVPHSQAMGYWTMWKSNQSTAGVPSTPRTIIEYKKKFLDAAVAAYQPLKEDSGIAEACKTALIEAGSRANTDCGDTGEPRPTGWILAVGAKCYVNGIAVR